MICEPSGEVCCGHCNCMAGLGEACTHIGAVLFYLETCTKVNNGKTCTQLKCQWVVPKYQKEIPYLPVKDLDFTSAKKSYHITMCSPQGSCSQWSSQEKGSCVTVKKPESSELDNFFTKLSQCSTKPAILSIVTPYSDSYIPKTIQPTFPKPLQQLYDEKYLDCNYLELLAVCEQVEITVTKEMAIAVETETRTQSNCSLWFTYQAGRVTASRMKSVCHTDSSNPSQSLVKAIAYPETFKFRSKATSWGCKHEKQAREVYTKRMLKNHHEFSVADSGLSLNPKWPHLGASPDGVINCQCCSKGVMEIKCPYCRRNYDINDSVNDKHYCLKKDHSGTIHLDQSHAYYYQVQTQIFICEVEYCDFVVCHFPEDHRELDIHIERVLSNEEFWSGCIEVFRFFQGVHPSGSGGAVVLATTSC